MDTKQAYNLWASQYDTNDNKTRDLEGKALRESLDALPFRHVLEIGCGTGKNTEWLAAKAGRVVAVDLSEEMLARAKAKVTTSSVEFRQADINQPWNFESEAFDLITFSLVLEHIFYLGHVFHQASLALKPGGYLYVGELHPFKQYTGTKARFDTDDGRQIVECYNHHTSDFIQAARLYDLQLVDLQEHFDTGDRSGVPRILTLLFTKSDRE